MLTIVIPAFNEAKTIERVVRQLLQVSGSVLVVDDGSRDTTGEVAQSAGARVLTHDVNLGYDASIADGVNEAFKTGATAVVTCDADGQHQVEDVRRISKPVLDDDADFCAGVRDHYNRPIEAIVGVASKLLFGTADPFCGLKCYSRKLWDASGAFPHEMNIGTLPLIWIGRNNYRALFLPIAVKKRGDHSRFGPFLRSNVRLARAFVATALKSRHGR